MKKDWKELEETMNKDTFHLWNIFQRKLSSSNKEMEVLKNEMKEVKSKNQEMKNEIEVLKSGNEEIKKQVDEILKKMK